ncbi:hypothetical protein ACOMHN_047721 [Nucella lapillus]
MFLQSDQNRMVLYFYNNPALKYEFSAKKDFKFIMKRISANSGCAIAPEILSSQLVSFCVGIKDPPGRVIVISVQKSRSSVIGNLATTVRYTSRNTTQQTAVRVSVGYNNTAVNIFHTDYVRVCGYNGFSISGLTLYFSFQPEAVQPLKLPSGLLNCSTDHYDTFLQHVRCNLQTECEDGWDETERCPFSSPGCRGLVASRHKCFHFIPVQANVNPHAAGKMCREIGGRLASIKTRREQEDALNVFNNYNQFESIVGQDCPDFSDESFCEHPSCTGFLCSNGQCVSYGQRCNEYSDCLDDSDEIKCPENFKYYALSQSMVFESPLSVFQNKTDSEGHSEGSSLPLTHFPFRPSQFMVTCSDGRLTHAVFLCGSLHDVTCGRNNTAACSFYQSVSFTALFPHIRSLDATGSGMSLSDVSDNTYLVHLVLAKCSLTFTPNASLPNLRFLDLSDNEIRYINVSAFLQLENLQKLSLSNNFRMSLDADPSPTMQQIRLCVHKVTSSSGFIIFVTNLTMADFLMGIYTVIIGAADEIFRGRYLHYDDMWKSSATCKMAGVLSLLSSEVSAMIILLITLDRFLVLRFSFSNLRFDRATAALSCLIVWLVGWVLALLPLLLVTSHWEFYSQTGICIPLPVTRQKFKGKLYSFSVFIVFNFVLFLLISSG